MDTRIRKANVFDACLLAALGAQTFYDAFASYNKAEDMEAYMNIHYTENKLVTELNAEGAEFYIAYLDDRAVGFAKTGEAAPPEQIAQFKYRELERIYVLKEYQSHKIGEQLLSYCIEKANTDGIEVLWLGVWEHNPRAIAFYQRFGFKRFGEHVFQLGSDPQTDWLMKLELR